MFGGWESGPESSDAVPKKMRYKKRSPVQKERNGKKRVSTVGAQFRRFLGRDTHESSGSEGPNSRSASPVGLFARRRAMTAAVEPGVPGLRELIEQEERRGISTGVIQQQQQQTVKSLTISSPIPHPDPSDMMYLPQSTSSAVTSPRYPSVDAESFASSTIPAGAILGESPRSSCSNDEEEEDEGGGVSGAVAAEVSVSPAAGVSQ